MRRLIALIISIYFLLIFLPGNSYCYAAESKLELDWDYLTPHADDRNLYTVSLHIFKKISEKKDMSIYRGITITQPHGDITVNQQNQSSSAIGVGPTYMIRTEKYHSDKLSVAIDISGGLIIYNKPFPAGGRYFNFMWRIGPQFIYKINTNSSINVGYMAMHVSNGFKTANPSYNAQGVSLGFATNF